jgi:DNA uptake protein ComE-like DNA-binding protein
MCNLRNVVVLCAVLGLTSAVYADQGQMMTDKMVTKPKAEKIMPKKMLCKLDLNAVNAAPMADLEKAVSAKAAKRIIDARTKLGGKFDSEKQLAKEAKVGKKMLKKLAKVFCLKEAEVKMTTEVKKS